ncbi:MAG: LPS assembly lipoprotein LptE [Planctomycetota bacterium]
MNQLPHRTWVNANTSSARPGRSIVILFTGLLACVWTGAGCAGYQVGNRTLYRQDVRTVQVPIVESDSLRRQLGERLTEAIVKQLELNSSYKVVGSADAADSVLRCRLIGDQKRVLAETRTDEMRATALSFQVQMEWMDRRNQSLLQRTELPLPSSLLTIAQSKTMIAETGQSVASTQQAALDALARQIVEQMEAAW